LTRSREYFTVEWTFDAAAAAYIYATIKSSSLKVPFEYSLSNGTPGQQRSRASELQQRSGDEKTVALFERKKKRKKEGKKKNKIK